MTHAVGSLVRARGREWVVLPESDEDLVVVRPLGGTDAEVTGILAALEPIEPAIFQPPDPDQLGDYRSGRLLREALRLGFRASGEPFRSFGRIAVTPRPYQLVPLLMALRLDRRLTVDESLFERHAVTVVTTRLHQVRPAATTCVPRLNWSSSTRRTPAWMPAVGACAAANSATSCCRRWPRTPAATCCCSPPLRTPAARRRSGRCSPCFVQRRRADIRAYLDEEAPSPGARAPRPPTRSRTATGACSTVVAFARETTVGEEGGTQRQGMRWRSALRAAGSLASRRRGRHVAQSRRRARHGDARGGRRGRTAGGTRPAGGGVDVLEEGGLFCQVRGRDTGGGAVARGGRPGRAGSGHFLVAAARQIARRLAQLRTGESEPTRRRPARRCTDVVYRCIYGVDSTRLR